MMIDPTLPRLRVAHWFAVVACVAISVFHRDADAQTVSYDSVYAQFSSLAIDARRCSAIHDVTIVRDVARFHFDSGRVMVLTPVAGRVVGILFRGTGEAIVTPPTRIERDQLRRSIGDTVLRRSFTSLCLVFTDTTLAELSKGIALPGTAIDRADQALVDEGVSYVRDERLSWCDPVLMGQLLNERSDGYFHAQIDSGSAAPFFFRIVPDDDEEVSVERGVTVTGHAREVLCQFPLRRALADTAPAVLDRTPFEITRYVIDCSFADNLAFAARASIDLRALVAGQAWIRVSLSPVLDVDSVVWDGGHRAAFSRGHRSRDLWIQCDRPLARGESHVCHMYYHGDLIARRKDYLSIQGATWWYPTNSYRHTALFDLTYHVADGYTLVSVGDSVSSVHAGGMVTSRWITQAPIRNASFTIGIFDRIDVVDSLVGPVSILTGKYGHSGFGADMSRIVADDIVKSLRFYRALFGTLPLSHLYATEIPGTHGEAFPGLIHLAWGTFQQQGSRGYSEVFRAHEVAHQWWGINVDFATYHDQWISEALSDFSGLSYMQTVMHDNEKYFNMLERWKKAIVENRQYLFTPGQEAGPIWLGHRTNSMKTRGDYDLIIYKKGAWVMHMLRNLLIDVTTMNEDVLFAILRDIQQQYSGKKTSTQDFRAVVERHVGHDMGWFFNEWIYGTDIPTYTCAYSVDKAPADKYVVHCRIVQRNTDSAFQMPMIVKADFGDGRFARMRITVRGPVTVVDLPPMPLPPKDIVFNDLESVLCTVEKAAW